MNTMLSQKTIVQIYNQISRKVPASLHYILYVANDFAQHKAIFWSTTIGGIFEVCLFNIISLTCLISATGIICAELGQCSDSIFLATVQASDSMDCLNQCKSDDRCNYGTFKPTGLLTCTFFTNCTIIKTDNILCPDCLTSSEMCSTCFVTGLCSVSYYLLFKMIQRLVEFHSCTKQLRQDMVAKLSQAELFKI